MLNLPPEARNRGFTLIELMVALVLGLVVVGGVMGVFISTYQANSQNIKAVRLNEEMRAVMSLVTRDIRRAGTRSFSWNATSVNWFVTNYFAVVPGPNWVVSRYSNAYPNYSCVLFSYDRDGDNALTNTDRFGYRLKDGRVEHRNGSGTTCAGAGWEGISDERTARVLSLSFTATITPPDYTPNFPPAAEAGAGVSVIPVTITLRAATNTRATDPTKNAAGSALTAADCTNIDVVCRILIEKIRLRNDAVL
jgi:prepilin-type N-terminal cleavage/methylation domain-containing protein